MRRAHGLIRGIAAGLCGAALLAGPVRADALKKVRIVVGTNVLNVTYPWVNLPGPLGYWKQEGYDVDVEPVGASLQVVQQMVGRNADFGEVDASVLLESNLANNIPVRDLVMTKVTDTVIAVPKDSPIQKAEDLKGKTVGVFSLASGGVPLLKSYLSAHGLDPNRDVSLIATGLGAPAVNALRTNRVQALFFWGAANASFENAGLDLRYIADPAWGKLPDFSFVTLQPTIDADPKMAVGIARGVAKATLFALTNPDCVRQLQWKLYPRTKPTGADEATLAKWDLHSLNAQLAAVKLAYQMTGSLFGPGQPADYARVQDFMFTTKQISKKMDPADLLVKIPDFVKQVNDFDHDAVIKQAQACTLP